MRGVRRGSDGKVPTYFPTLEGLLVNENNQLGLAAVCLGHYVMDSQVPNAVRPKLDHWSFVELI